MKVRYVIKTTVRSILYETHERELFLLLLRKAVFLPKSSQKVSSYFFVLCKGISCFVGECACAVPCIFVSFQLFGFCSISS